MSVQIIASRGTSNLTTGALFSSLNLQSWSSTALFGSQRWMASGVFRNFRMWTTVTPGGVATRTFALAVNGVASAMSVTIANPDNYAQYTATTIPVTAGDLIRINHTNVGTPTTCQTWCAFEFVPTTPGQCSYGSMSITNESTGSAENNAVFYGGETWSGTFPASIATSDGTLTGYGVTLSDAPTATRSRVFNVWKNGVKQDGTGGTVDTTLTIADAATSGSVNFSLPVLAGDRVFHQMLPTNTPVLSRMVWGFRFEPTNIYASTIGGWSNGQPTNAATNYCCPARVYDTTSATETSHVMFGTLTPSFMTKLFIAADGAAPGAGKSWTISSRLAQATPAGALSAQMTGTGTPAQANDVAHTMALDSNSIFNLMIVPAGTPTASQLIWANELVYGVTVPDVVLDSQADATTALQAVDLVVGLDSVHSDIVPIGDVVSQSVAAASVAQAGSTVTITISLGPIGGTSTEFVYRYRYGNQY